MGIHDYYKIVVEKNKEKGNTLINDLGVKVSLSSLKGKTIIVDTGYFIHNSVQAYSNPTKDDKGNITAHINTIFYKITNLEKHGIKQIWVFDPPPEKINPLKYDTIKERNKKAKKATDEKEAFRIKNRHIQDIKNLLDFMGITYIQSPNYVEAEQFGSFLCNQIDEETGTYFADYVLTTDSDVLAFGGNLLKITKQASTYFYTIFNYRDILRKAELTKEEHTRMCVVMGSDFAPKTPKIGAATVKNKVKSGTVMLTERQQQAYDLFMEDVKIKCIEMLKNDIDSDRKNLLNKLDYSKIRCNELFIHRSKYDRNKVLKFLEDYDFGKKEMGRKKMIKNLDEHEKYWK